VSQFSYDGTNKRSRHARDVKKKPINMEVYFPIKFSCRYVLIKPYDLCVEDIWFQSM
jgi:hypothetical protein